MAIKIRKFSEDKTSELITIDRLPWSPFSPATGNDIICTSLQVQSSGMSIGLAKGAEYGVGLYDFTGKLIKTIKTESSRMNEHFSLTKRNATQAVTDRVRRGTGWQTATLLAYDASDPHTGNPTLFEYNHQDQPFWSNILGQIFVAIGYTTTEINGIVASSAPNNTVYYKFDILTAPNALPQWITPLYPAVGIDPYTGGFPAARISKIAFADPRDSNNMTTYTISEDTAGASSSPIGVSDALKVDAYMVDNRDTTFQDILVIPNRKIIYNICKRVHAITDPTEVERPIEIRNNDTGVPIQISMPPIGGELGVIPPNQHPLQLGEGVQISGLTHDRQNKYVMSFYHSNPPEDRSKFQGKLFVIPTSFHKAIVDITPLSFINATLTNEANNIAVVDEARKSVYVLDSSTDNWMDFSYNLYRGDKLFAPPEISPKDERLMRGTNSEYPIGRYYRDGGTLRVNQFYFYDEFASGASDNLYPRWINYDSDTNRFEVGEFLNTVWQYNRQRFSFDSTTTIRKGTKDKSGKSILYNDRGNDTIEFFYNNAGDSAALTSATGWRAISVNNFKLIALRNPLEDNKFIVDVYGLVGGSVEKIRSYELDGFELINPTGIAWTGVDRIYVVDAGQRDNQIIKYTNDGNALTSSETLGSLGYRKTIQNPTDAVPRTEMQAACIERTAIVNPTGTAQAGFTQTVTRMGDEVCVNLPLSGTEAQKELYSGFLPINDIPKGISGKQLSLRIRITHNRYLDIGTVFMEASGPQVRN